MARNYAKVINGHMVEARPLREKEARMTPEELRAAGWVPLEEESPCCNPDVDETHDGPVVVIEAERVRVTYPKRPLSAREKLERDAAKADLLERAARAPRNTI